MYNYSFKVKRKEGIFNIDGMIFKEDEKKAKEVFNSIVNYEVEFYKNLRNEDVEIFDKDFNKFNNEIPFTKYSRRNLHLENKLSMTDEERKEIEELTKQFK